MSNFTIPILIEELYGLDRIQEPARVGIPFSRGAAFGTSKLRLRNDEGNCIPFQIKKIAAWSDGSIKWVLVDFFISLKKSQRTSYELFQSDGNDAPPVEMPVKLKIQEKAECIFVDTGIAKYEVQRQRLRPFASVRLQNSEIISAEDSEVIMTDSKGRKYFAEIENLLHEEEGPLRSSMCAYGKFVHARKKPLCSFKARLSFFASLSIIQLDLVVHNPRAALHPAGLWDLGDPGSVFFRDLSIQLQLNSVLADPKVDYQIYEDPVPMDYSVRPDCPCDLPAAGWEASHDSRLLIYQDSSGGENWNSTNHLNHKGDLSVSFRGYRVSDTGSSSNHLIGEGMRAIPHVKIKSNSGWVAGAVKDFWQNFPKALRVHNNLLSLGVFPKENNHFYELQGGEQKRHSIFIEFGAPENQTMIPQMQKPLHVYPAPQWIEASKSISYFTQRQDDTCNAYTGYVKNVIEGPNSFFNKRELIDEYGWRNFGELYADHEAVNHKGSGNFVSHYNNQYDFIYGALIHFLETGDRRWYELASAYARHVIDIDIYHTDEDKPAYNHGLFWHTDHYQDAGTSTHRTYTRKALSSLISSDYGGGPSNEHVYTTGLLLYYYLTGDLEARNAVLELANWVIALDDGSQTLLGLVDDGPTGAATWTKDVLYHKPGRGAGNSINALMDAYRLTNDRKFMSKAEELIQRCIHPRDDLAKLKLDDPEYRWSYLVFLQILGKYLDYKAELGEKDFHFFCARDSLLHYTEWMAEHEVPYKDVLHKVEIPTETWPAHDIRKCHIFNLASKYGTLERRPIFKRKAEFFFDRCLNDLLNFETAYLTRPMVILAVYGPVHTYFQKYDFSNMPFEEHAYDFGRPIDFIPQKIRFKQAAHRKAKVFARETKRLIRSKWHSWINRLRIGRR